MAELARWDSFYMIVGPSAGALIGLQFVVLTLIAARPPRSGGDGNAAGNAFGTPTIVHFGVVLLVSAILRAPWDTIEPAAVICGLVGLAGTIYAIVTILRLRRLMAYRPEFEDWLFHAILPLIAYVLLAAAAAAIFVQAHDALFAVGATTLLLLFVSIHNAWDAILYHVYAHVLQTDEDGSD
jgi:hypothetical protein